MQLLVERFAPAQPHDRGQILSELVRTRDGQQVGQSVGAVTFPTFCSQIAPLDANPANSRLELQLPVARPMQRRLDRRQQLLGQAFQSPSLGHHGPQPVDADIQGIQPGDAGALLIQCQTQRLGRGQRGPRQTLGAGEHDQHR